MLKKYMGELRKYTCLSILLFIIFIALKYISTFVPDDQVKINVRDSINYMYEEEGIYPRFLINQTNFYSQQLDNYTDSGLLNMCYNMDKNSKIVAIAGDFRGGAKGGNPLEQTYNMLQTEEYGLRDYARQWNGQAAVLRILLGIFNYQQIRVISQFLFVLLMGILLLLIANRVGNGIAVVFFGGFVAINPNTTAACINLGAAFYVLLLGLIWVCKQYRNKRSAIEICYVVGALTAFFDLFSVPFVTFAVAVLMLCIDIKENEETTFSFLLCKTIKSGVAWLGGYVILWASKWGFASIVLKKNIFLNAWIEMKIQSVDKAVDWGPDTPGGLMLEALQANFYNLFPVNIIDLLYKKFGSAVFYCIVLLVFGVIVWIILNRKQLIFKSYRFVWLFVGIACIPYICYIVMHTHAFVHYWMWYRLQYITIVSLLSAVYFSFEKKKEIDSGNEV